MDEVRLALLALLWWQCFAGCSPLVRTAPEECPLKDGNILSVKLFVEDEITCKTMCQNEPDCGFYKFYKSIDGKPEQCFFFDACGRTVYEADRDCILSKENCLGITPFIESVDACRELCQNNKKCGFYKYIQPEEEEEGSTELMLPRGRQIPISRLADADTPEFCYLLTSCSKRMTENVLCTIGANNLLDVKLFIPSLAACQEQCEQMDNCRYYYWYPIDYSAAPLYCYLFQQCAAQDNEPEVALVIGGRHPGHYFISTDDFNDMITRSSVCPVSVSPAGSVMRRAGAGAHYYMEQVVLCGGRNKGEPLNTCLQYHLEEEEWSNHSEMARPRDESSMVAVGSLLFMIGGLGEDTVEYYDAEEETWKSAPQLPNQVARACAVFTGDKIMLIGGHDNSSTASLNSVLSFAPESGSWSQEPKLKVARRDHACLYVELERTRGVLVTGGLDDKDNVLDSVEFFDLIKQEWISVSPLKVPRTEHVISLVYGIPTVIGGVNGDEFLSSMEQLDKSSSSWNIPLQRDWRIINHVLTSPRYEHAVASIPVSKVRSCDNEIVNV